MLHYNLIKKIINGLLPTTCVLCGSAARQNIDLCAPCQADMPWVGSVCKLCALPMSANDTNQSVCGKCLHWPPPFTKTFALCRYEAPLDYLITAIKFNHKLVYARLLGELLADYLTTQYQNDAIPELIIPVPLHPQRLRERGFNQALEIARPVAKKLAIKMDFKSCHRIRPTQAQASLSADERAQNVKQAFQIKLDLKAKHIAVLDDVITTGLTMHAFCEQLQNNGIERIDVWCCARTPLHSNKL